MLTIHLEILDRLINQKSSQDIPLLIKKETFIYSNNQTLAAQEAVKSMDDLAKLGQTKEHVDQRQPILDGLLNPKYKFQLYEEWHKTGSTPQKTLREMQNDELSAWELCPEFPVQEIIDLLLSYRADEMLYFDMLAYLLIDQSVVDESYKDRVVENLDKLLEQFSLARLLRPEPLLSGIKFAEFVSDFHQTCDVALLVKKFPNLAHSILEWAFADEIDGLSLASILGEQHLLFGLITQFSEVALSDLLCSINYGCLTDRPEIDLPFFSVAMAEVVLYVSALNPFENVEWLEFSKTLERHNLFSFPQTRYAHSLALRRIPVERTPIQAQVLMSYERLGIRPNNYSDIRLNFNDPNAQLLWTNYVNSRSIFDPNSTHKNGSADLTAIFKKTHELGQAMEYEVQWIAKKLELKINRKHKNRNKNFFSPSVFSIFDALKEDHINNEAFDSFKISHELYNSAKHIKPLRDGSIDQFEKHIFVVFDALQKIKLDSDL
jgi:hypothetical protein